MPTLQSPPPTRPVPLSPLKTTAPLPQRTPDPVVKRLPSPSLPRHTFTDVQPPRLRLLCAALTAGLWWLAGQKMGWFALGWIALTPLLWALHGLDTRSRWKLGYLSGFISYVLINWWIVPTVARGGPMIGVPPLAGAALGALAVTLIALIHGFLVSLIAIAWDTRGKFAQRASWALPIVIALLWAALDAARLETQLAHGWGALAYTQWRDSALLQSGAIIGQHGLTALCVWFAASFALWMRRSDAFLWRAPVLVFIVLHLWGAWRLAGAESKQPPLRALLVQTNVPSLIKNGQQSGESPLAQASRLTREGVATGQGPFDIILWPETTVVIGMPRNPRPTMEANEKQGTMQAMEALCRETRTPILFGANLWTGKREVSNVAMLITPEGGVFSNAKQRLVPFGERASYSEYLPFLSQFAPNPPVTPAKQVGTMPLKVQSYTANSGVANGQGASQIQIGSFICFESCLRYPARTLGRAGAQVLFVLTNDEWFSGTNSPWEHAAMATVRAVENGVPVVQAANAGYSFVVDRYGRFVVNSSDTSQDILSGTPGASVSTFGTAQALPVTVPMP